MIIMNEYEYGKAIVLRLLIRDMWQAFKDTFIVYRSGVNILRFIK